MDSLNIIMLVFFTLFNLGLYVRTFIIDKAEA